MEAKVLSQSERRRPWRARDEFGRVWESTIDIISQGTCAPINPRGWNDPLAMPQKYLLKALTQDPETGQLGIRIIPALEQWSNDLEQDHKRYDEKLYNDALTLFGEAGVKAYEDRTPALINYTGVGPQAIEPVLAALSGYEWALGLSEKDPKNIRRFFPKQETAREKFLRELNAPDAELDPYGEIEEAADPQATGGKKQKVGKKEKAA